MRCNNFDAYIDEMLSGILHPDANQHMRQCERCTTHFHARAAVQNGLRKLASAAVSGPSLATDCAVMEAFRGLQQRRAAAWSSGAAPGAAAASSAQSAAAQATAVPTARLFTFPGRNLAPLWASRTGWTGAAAAAVVLAVFGSAIHLWTGVPTVNAPVVATAPYASAPQKNAAPDALRNTIVASNSASRRTSQRSPRLPSQPEVAATTLRSAPSVAPVLAAKAPSSRPSVGFAEPSSYDSAPVTQPSANVSPVFHLASSGAAGNVAQAASSTWPGYSNLMYCDPVVCSGPMQVVHIKVPVGQVRPNLGQSMGNAFVNAEVVIGPDGVARAIRVAN